MKSKLLKLLSAMVVTASIASAIPNTIFAKTVQEANVKIVYVLEYQLEPGEKVSDEDKKALQENGWIFDGQTIKRRYYNSNNQIDFNSKKKLTDKDGVFSIQLSKDEEDVDIQLTKNVKDVRNVHLKKGQTVLIEKKINMKDLANAMGNPVSEENVGATSYNAGPPSDGKKYYGGEDVHCNRFNGFLGNGTYYSSHIKGLLNFTQSDCDVSLGRGFDSNCWAEDLGATDNRYCAWSPSYKQGMCSLDVGHNWTFHQHTGFFSPSGW